MAVYQYQVENDDERYDFKSNFMSDSEMGREWIAQDAGEDFYNNHDGWEAEWPLELSLYDNGQFLGCFKVELESVPQFYSSLVTP